MLNFRLLVHPLLIDFWCCCSCCDRGKAKSTPRQDLAWSLTIKSERLFKNNLTGSKRYSHILSLNKRNLSWNKEPLRFAKLFHYSYTFITVFLVILQTCGKKIENKHLCFQVQSWHQSWIIVRTWENHCKTQEIFSKISQPEI